MTCDETLGTEREGGRRHPFPYVLPLDSLTPSGADTCTLGGALLLGLPRAMSRHAASAPIAVATPLARLHALRHRYGAAESAAKLQLIARIERRPPRSARGVQQYHDDLLFLRAFPDDARVLAAANAALSHTAARVHALPIAQRHALDDSGMAGTHTRHAFAFGIARWLVDAGEAVDIAWSAFEAPERLDPLLRLTLTQAETDAFDSGEISTREWLAMAQGGEGNGALAWLVHRSDPAAPPASGVPDVAVTRLMYENLEIPLRWRLTSACATTGNVVHDVAVHYRTAMRSAPADPAALITTPLPAIERLAPARAAAWLHAARAALAARCREVHAITYANPDEVYLADLGEGSSLCLIGAARDDRLALEANYGYVLFSNGVPVGYGGVTPLAAQANTGVNVFDAFRRSEALFLFAQALRAFRTLFGVTRFIVNPYQFGAGNDEAVASGAFWFYDRLGFRPVDARVRRLADRERSRCAADPGHRTPLATLRRLAEGDLVLELPGAARTPLFEERWLVTLARAVTQTFAAPDIPARVARRDAAVDAVAQALGLRGATSAANGASFGLSRLAPVFSLVLREVERWPLDDRRALRHVLEAKGELQERDFAVASREHRRLWSALRRQCRALEAGR